MDKGSNNVDSHQMIAKVVFFFHPLRAWEQGVVLSVGEQNIGSVATIRCRSGETLEIAVGTDTIFLPTTPGFMRSCPDDLLELPVLHDALLLHVLQVRYSRDLTYTRIGEIILSVNPFKAIPSYMDSSMCAYLEQLDTPELPPGVLPHVWCVAHGAYVNMRVEQRNHSIIASGESGSGKTEACKTMLKYLCAASERVAKNEITVQRMQRVTEKVQMSNIILESFGNAKTVKNDNSSRFGKLMELQFDAGGVMAGVRVTPFLLERSRVVTCGENERVYHVFHQLVAGAGKEVQERLRIGRVSEFSLLLRGGRTSLKTNGMNDIKDFQLLQNALVNMGFSSEEQNAMWNVIGSILHMQNIVFQVRRIDDSASMRNEDMETALFVATQLLQVPNPNAFVDCLTTCVISLGEERLVRKLTVQRAKDQLDGICKFLYSKIFYFIIHRINLATANGADLDVSNADQNPASSQLFSKDGSTATWIALLDIFGFENFPVNSLEQFCINLSNEALQRQYIERVFVTDMEEMRAEGVEPNITEFTDNQLCLELLQGSRNSIISFLDDASALDVERSKSNPDFVFLNAITSAFSPDYQTAPGKATCSVLDRNGNMDTPSAYFYRGRLDDNSFTIRHYAGDVKYHVNSFVEKNNDFVRGPCTQVLQGTTSQMLQEFLGASEETVGLLGDVKASNSPMYSLRGLKHTVASNFRRSLRMLMDVLGSSRCNWVRCIRPHSIRQPGLFDGKLVLEQLVGTGVSSTIKQRQRNYPFRPRCEDFVRHYCVLLHRCTHSSSLSSPPLPPRLGMTLKGKCRALLLAAQINVKMAQVGKSRVFLTAEAQRVLESRRLQHLETLSVIIYQYAASFISRRYVRIVHITRHVIKLQRIYRTSLRIRRSVLQYYQELSRKRHEQFLRMTKSILRAEALSRLEVLKERESYMRRTWHEFRQQLAPLVAAVLRNLQFVETERRNGILLQAFSQYDRFGETFAQEAFNALERRKQRMRIKEEMDLGQRVELLRSALETMQGVVCEEQSAYDELWENVVSPGIKLLTQQVKAVRRFHRWRDKRLQELYAARALEKRRLAVVEAASVLEEEKRWRTVVGEEEYMKEMRYFRSFSADKDRIPSPLYALLQEGVPSEIMRSPIDSSQPVLSSIGTVTSFRDYREYMQSQFRHAHAGGVAPGFFLHPHCDGISCDTCKLSSYPLDPEKAVNSPAYTFLTDHVVHRRLLDELSDGESSFDELSYQDGVRHHDNVY